MLVVVLIAIVAAVLGVAGGFIWGVYAERYRGVPLWQVEDRWSIGIYFGESPLKLAAPVRLHNPVLTAKDVTDLKADFVADPFMVREGEVWHMFFEVMDAASYRGKIALALSEDGIKWDYQSIVLDEPFHLSYPYVFKWQDDYYLIPECYAANAVRLYKAVEFPLRWSFVGELLRGSYVDASVFRYGDQWWLLAAEQEGNHTLHLFQACDLAGPWREHPQSPVVSGDTQRARPGGRVLVLDGRIIRYAQDCTETYGGQLRAFEVTELTHTSYQEKEITLEPVLKATGHGWNKDGMHHADPHLLSDGRWIACVDGNRKRTTFRFKY